MDCDTAHKRHSDDRIARFDKIRDLTSPFLRFKMYFTVFLPVKDRL